MILVASSIWIDQFNDRLTRESDCDFLPTSEHLGLVPEIIPQ